MEGSPEVVMTVMMVVVIAATMVMMMAAPMAVMTTIAAVIRAEDVAEADAQPREGDAMRRVVAEAGRVVARVRGVIPMPEERAALESYREADGRIRRSRHGGGG